MSNTWPWRRTMQRAIEVLRTEDWRSLWFKTMGETVYRRVVVMERNLDEPALVAETRLPVVFGQLRETEADEYTAFRPETDMAEVRRRLQTGQQCSVARHEGRLVHVCWIATGHAWIDYLARETLLAPGEAYIYESFTTPGFRGRNVVAARSAYMQRELRNAGYRRLVAVVVPENKTAFRPLEKIGYHPAGMMGYVRFGPWRLQFGRRTRRESPDTSSPVYWDSVAQPHYLDSFLGKMKRQAYLDLVNLWGDTPATGRTLKTDLFEEAMGSDAFLTDLGGSLVVGIDVSPATTKQARQRNTGQRATYVVADVRCLPFADGSFDLVVSPSTLDHFADPADLGRSLCELARVLDPSGRLIVTLDNRQNVFDPLLRLVIRLGLAPYYIGRSYTAAELRAQLEGAGLTVQDMTAILHNPRLVATGIVAIANWLGWLPLIHLVQRALMKTQQLESTRWRYHTGCFVAALAVRSR